MIKLLTTGFIIILTSAFPALADEAISGDHVEVSWLAPDTVKASDEILIGVHFKLDPEWHVYWKNPGDSGAAPKLQVQTSTAQIGDIQWPYPQRLPFGHLTNLGYENEVALILPVKIKNEDLRLDLKLEWLVCKEDCIPGFGNLHLHRPLAAQTTWQTEVKEKIDHFIKRVPTLAVSNSLWQPVVRAASEQILLILKKSDEFATPEAFPVDGNVLTANAPETREDQSTITYAFDLMPGAQIPERVEFVVASEGRAWEFKNLPVASATTAGSEPYALILLFAFLGGLILNLMPCVFPVISLKFFSLVNVQDSVLSRVRSSLLYTAGVLFTFISLGAVLLGLRESGMMLGWGYQLQSPFIILFLIILFWLMALNFLGVFEFGSRLMNYFGKASPTSSFGSGVLAVFVAAPCTGPFMGTALGAAATLAPLPSLLIFAGLGLGLASPFLLFAFAPKLVGFLPKPGPWMDTFKQFLAFPLLATVLWLMWVLGSQIGNQGWVLAASLLLVTSFCLWLGRSRRKGVQFAAWLLAGMALVFSIQELLERQPISTTQAQEDVWRPYSEDALQAALQSGQPVFVDFTAAWCITCQVNKKAVLERPVVLDLFHNNGVLLLRADWTNYDPKITAALSKLGRNSVPVYAYYASAETETKILPQILSVSVIEELFNSKEVTHEN